MSCNLRTINGKEVGFTDAGTPSKLFRDAVGKLGEKEGKEVFLVSLSDDFKETIPPTEKYNPKKIAAKYSSLISQIKREQAEDYWSVDMPSQEDINKAAEAGRIVDVKGGMGLVTEDGNMIGLFKYDPSQVGTAAAVQAARIQMGGIKLDNFDGYLTRTYIKNGFRVAARIPFNEEYAPEGWNKEKHGTPDVVFMVYDPNNKLDIQEKVFEDYNEAMDYRDTYVELAKVGHPAYSVSPANSSNYANLTEDGKGNFVFFHRGGRGYEVIKKTSGATTATSRGEASAISKVGGVAMYYTAPEDSESMVSGTTKYAVKVPKEKVYDFNSDPLNLIAEAKALHAKENPGKAFDANTQVAYITKLAGEKGYDMVVSEWNGRTRAQTTKELTPLDTEEKEGSVITKPFKEGYTSNRELGYVSNIPETKEDKLDEVYKSIHNERNSQNKYDKLYHLSSSPSRPSQEEITKMILESDISAELKNKYQEALNTQPQKRQSFTAEEPSLEDVMKYITSQNESKEPMNTLQVRDYKNALIATKRFSFENLKKAFYDEKGIFFVSPSKLVSSGLYSQYEAEHLKKDLDLQEQVKASIDALKNTDGIIIPTQEDFEQVEKENIFTSFGKLNNLNPHIVQKQIQNTLAAATRKEFDEALGEIPFSKFQESMRTEDAQNALFKDMQMYKKAEMMLEDSGEIKPSLISNTEVVMQQVAEHLEGKKVLGDINYFLAQDLNILKANPAETLTLLSSIENNLINEGYDVIGLTTKATDVNLMQYLQAIKELSEIPTKTSLGNYVEVYDEYFEKDLSPRKGFIKTEQDDRNFVRLDTELKEEDAYNQRGLIKQSEGVYIRVNKKTTDELYPIVLTYPERIPQGIKKEDELRRYVQGQVMVDEVTDAETAEVINLFKLYYEIPLREEGKKENISEYNQKQAQFTGNQEYLLGGFVADFYKKSLKAKAGNTQEYKDFYAHFEVTEKGLEMINTDPITLDTIQSYITEDLKNYSLLSKSMPSLITEEVDFVDSRNSRRNKVVNYPSLVPKFLGDVSIIDNSNLVAKNTSAEFIRLKGDVYENTQTIGNLAMFKKLDSKKSNFLNFAVEKPNPDFLLEDYLHLENKPESFIKAKNYLSKDEKDGLAEDEFGCL